MSTGKPSEKNLYADVDAAWQALRTRYGISPENVILYGQSIGTVPTVDLASRSVVLPVVTNRIIVDYPVSVMSWHTTVSCQILVVSCLLIYLPIIEVDMK